MDFPPQNESDWQEQGNWTEQDQYQEQEQQDFDYNNEDYSNYEQSYDPNEYDDPNSYLIPGGDVGDITGNQLLDFDQEKALMMPMPTSATPGTHTGIQQTLALIKPEAMGKAEEIQNIIGREGLTILQSRAVHLTPEQAASFYMDQYEEDWFAGAVQNLSSGPVLALILCGPQVVRHWLELMGPSEWKERSEAPTSMRYLYGVKESDYENGLHGSANPEEALRELHFFFPAVIVEPILGDSLATLYLNQNVHPVLTVGLSKLVREKPQDPVMWLADWLLANNPNKPRELNPNGTTCT